MKSRYGFISNSSSTSFLIYGYCSEHKREDAIKIAKALNLEYNEEDDDYTDMFDKLAEVLNDKTDKTFYCYYPESDAVYIGVSYHQIRSDETGGDFRSSIETAIHEVLPEVTVGDHDESW